MPTGPSRRAFEVLDLLLEGRTQVDVARLLVLSPHTVGHHVAALRAFYKVDTVEALIATVLNGRLDACRAELAKTKRDLAALDRRGKPSTVDVIGEPMGRA